jgi:HAD superfamily hydrolase (TIGR01509 family)
MMNDFSKILDYKGIIFDLDGTLIDSMKYHIKAWQEVAARYGVNLSYEYLHSHGGVPSIKIAQEIVHNYHLEETAYCLAGQKTEKYVSYIPMIEIYPMARELMDFAKLHGIRMIIATGTLKSNVEKIMARTDLGCYIRDVISSEDVMNHKPAPDTFCVAAERIGVSCCDSIVFEDAPLGIQAAKNGNFDCCVVKDGTFDLNKIIHATTY